MPPRVFLARMLNNLKQVGEVAAAAWEGFLFSKGFSSCSGRCLVRMLNNLKQVGCCGMGGAAVAWAGSLRSVDRLAAQHGKAPCSVRCSRCLARRPNSLEQAGTQLGCLKYEERRAAAADQSAAVGTPKPASTSLAGTNAVPLPARFRRSTTCGGTTQTRMPSAATCAPHGPVTWTSCGTAACFCTSWAGIQVGARYLQISGKYRDIWMG